MCSLSILQNALQLDDKIIVSTGDDVLSSRNHMHLITTRKQIQDCSFVCHAVQNGNDRVMIRSIDACPSADAGLWVVMVTWMQLCYILAHLVYACLGPDQSKALTSFYTFSGCDTTFCFSERINKWLASKLINRETFLPGTNKLSQRYTEAVPWVLSEQQPPLSCVSVAGGRHHLTKSLENIPIWGCCNAYAGPAMPYTMEIDRDWQYLSRAGPLLMKAQRYVANSTSVVAKCFTQHELLLLTS